MAYLGLPVRAPGGQPVGALCVVETNPRKWTDEEIDTLTKLAVCVGDVIALQAALLASERQRNEQRRFTYAISHDLKSPANTLHMLLMELGEERHRLSNEGQKFFDTSLNNVVRMAGQIEEVLNYTRATEMPNRHERVDVNKLWSDLISDLQGDINAMAARVQCAEMQEIVGNAVQIRVLFQNILTNALKYQPQGQIPVVNISGRTDSEGKFDEIQISDNGIGIAPENQTRIFELFSRLHVRSDYPGTGIGLALCKRVVENHNGSLTVSSELGSGSTFTIRLPRVIQCKMNQQLNRLCW